MTSKADFTDEEWTTVLQGPPSAGMMVVTDEALALASQAVRVQKTHS